MNTQAFSLLVVLQIYCHVPPHIGLQCKVAWGHEWRARPREGLSPIHSHDSTAPDLSLIPIHKRYSGPWQYTAVKQLSGFLKPLFTCTGQRILDEIQNYPPDTTVWQYLHNVELIGVKVKVKVLVYSLVLALAAINTTLQASHYLQVREFHWTFNEFPSAAHFAHL